MLEPARERKRVALRGRLALLTELAQFGTESFLAPVELREPLLVLEELWPAVAMARHEPGERRLFEPREALEVHVLARVRHWERVENLRRGLLRDPGATERDVRGFLGPARDVAHVPLERRLFIACPGGFAAHRLLTGSRSFPFAGCGSTCSRTATRSWAETLRSSSRARSTSRE